MISLQNISLSYAGQRVLNEVNFSFQATGLYVILGNNGTGKTSLLKIICGINKPTTGKVFYGHQEAYQLSIAERSNIVSYTDDPFPLPAFMSLKEYLKIGLPHSKDTELILEQHKIANLKQKPVVQLSRGQQQKAMLAKLFFQDNPVWLMDEPSNYLDYPSVLNFWEQVKIASQHKLIICTVHNPEEALKLNSEILLLRNQSIVFLGKDVSLQQLVDGLREES